MCKDCGCGYPERRWLRFLILRIVYESPAYGYDILKRIGSMSPGGHEVKGGTMYTTLRRMEKEGLLESAWEKNESGPDKRRYTATSRGEAYLKKWLEMVIERRKMVNEMARFYKEHFGG
jgi:PadR family transcriptional regulator, regulatory protein PadR